MCVGSRTGTGESSFQRIRLFVNRDQVRILRNLVTKTKRRYRPRVSIPLTDPGRLYNIKKTTA